MSELRKTQFLDPKDIPGLGKRYTRHPGPYAIGFEALGMMFPGMNVNPAEIDLDAPEPIYGDMNGSETYVLTRVVGWQKPKVIVEYGTLYGRSTALMAKHAAPNARILTVDLPDDVRRTGLAPYSTDDVFMRGDALPLGHYHLTSPHADQVTQIRMDARSQEFKQTLDDWLAGDTIDFALVDASHDYETTRGLFTQAHQRLTPGGIIMNDDYGAKDVTHIGVTRAFANLAGEKGMKFYWFTPFPAPEGWKTPSALLYVDLPETRGNHREGFPI